MILIGKNERETDIKKVQFIFLKIILYPFSLKFIFKNDLNFLNNYKNVYQLYHILF